MIWIPSPDFRYSMRRGMTGTDVAALQANLSPRLLVDGDFGPRTERAVKRFQRARPRLVTDGIAGPVTQAAIANRRIRPIETRLDVPKGLLRSIASNESGLFLGSCGKHAADEGWDVGVFARSTGKTPGSQEFLDSAYDVAESAEWTGRNTLESYERVGDPADSSYLYELAGGDRARYRWCLAVFAHNWPAAVFGGTLSSAYAGIARAGRIYWEAGRDDRPADWIAEATGGRLRTPREWARSYVERSTVYVRW